MTGKILFMIVSVCFGLMLWVFWQYTELPTVKFSVNRQRVVAVENFKGEALPLSPLPEKYEKVYVD